MAITYDWQINRTAMESDISDGYISKLVYRVNGMEDGVQKWRETGEVNFTKHSSLPSDFIAFDSVKESDCITWLKTALGSTEVTRIENNIKAQIDLLNTPVKKIGAPAWS